MTETTHGYTAYCDSGPASFFPSLISKKVLSIPISPCYQNMYHNTVVFGDSWTANGRGPLKKESYESGNYEGRMTNGPTWVEYLATFMGTDLYDQAYSGATANNSILPRSVPDINQQIAEFHAKGENLNNNETLYIVWTGVNDIHDIYNKTSDPLEQNTLLNSIIESITNEINALQPADHLVIMGLAPIQHLPLFSSPHEYTDTLLNLIKTFNVELKALSQKDKSSSIKYIDIHSLFKKYIQSNEDGELAELTLAFKQDLERYSNSQFSYLWWDEWHPTTFTHQLIAADVYHMLHSDGTT